MIPKSAEAQSDRFMTDDTLPWIHFSWSSGNLGGRLIEKTAMIVPLKIEELPYAFEAQFDLGACSTMIYGKAFAPYLAMASDIREKIDTTQTVFLQGASYPCFADLSIQLDGVEFPNRRVVFFEDFGTEEGYRQKYTEKDLVKIAKRENNTKRNYLVVDPLQGKHIPVVPSKALDLFAALADTFREKYKDEKLLLVGFAETATAIGAQAAITVGADYIQTTREVIPGVNYLFFSEEHSHATEQKLVKDDIDRAAAETDRIIFIEDEVTTGKTIRNIISILDREYDGKFKYSVASLLNGMSEENLERYKRQGISLYYLVKTDHSTYGDRAETFKGDGFYYKCPDKASEYTTIYVKDRMDARRLIDPGKYEEACENLWREIREKTGNMADNISGKRILVIGTEEFMFPALYIGRKMEKEGAEVRCHSTTRSPIAVSLEKEYPLHSRYELKSLYDPDRRTFIYDIGKYDKVLIVTDSPEIKESQETLINAVRMQNKDITVVRWC